MRISGLLVFLFLPRLVSARPTLESLKAGSETTLLETSIQARAFKPPTGRTLDVTVAPILSTPMEKRFEAIGTGVRLRIDGRSFGSMPLEYEVEGRIFDRSIGHDEKLKITQDSFPATHPITAEGAGLRIRMSRAPAVGNLDMETTLDGSNAETAAVVMALLDVLPGPADSTQSLAAQTPAAPFPFSYHIYSMGRDQVQVQGPDIWLSIEKRPWGAGWRYTVKGRGFGKDFDFKDELEVETNPGPIDSMNFQVRGCGIDFSVRSYVFGGGKRLELRGRAGDSAELAAFAMALGRFASAR